MSTTMKWGLITGAVYVILSMISNLMGIQDGEGFSMAGFFYSIVVLVSTGATIYLGTKEIRDTQLDGFLSFGQGFKSGMAIALIAAIISAVFTYIYIEFIDPGLIDKLIATTEAQWEEKNMPEEQMEMSRQWMGYMMNPLVMSLFATVSVIFWGLIKSLIAAAVLKKDAPPFIPED
jgi:uncharacterized membrane protein YhaH (DUF805 family)